MLAINTNNNKNHYAPIPLLKNTNNSTTTLNNLQQVPLTLPPLNNNLILSSPINTPINTSINPFGNTNNNTNYSNNNNNNNNHIISQQSLLSPITPITPITDTSSINNNNTVNTNHSNHSNHSNHTPQYPYSSPVYDTNNTTTNNIVCDESAVHEIKFTLIHNPTDPTAPKYRWSANIQSFNGPLSNKLIQTLTNTTCNTNLHTNSERMDFCIDFTDKRLSWLLPFNADMSSINISPNISKENSINNTNHTNNTSSVSSIISEDVFPITTPPSIISQQKPVIPTTKYKYSDKSKESGYCLQCDKYFDGYRGLISHRSARHNKRNSNGPLSERYIQEKSMESDTDSDSDLSSSYMPLPSQSQSQSRNRKRKRISITLGTNKKRRLTEDLSDSCGEMDTFSDEAPMRPITLVTDTNNNAEMKFLFDKCVKHKVRYLLGNTQWSDACEGEGLHKTRQHWCRYCGSRLSKRWYQRNRICSKHMYEWKKHKTFKLSATAPFYARKNAEFSYLKQFVEELDNVNTKDPAAAADADSDEAEEKDNDFDVFKIHSKKILFGEKDGKKLVYYLVEWSGYDLKESNWEPAGNLDCDEVLNEFEEKIKDGKMGDCVDCKIGGYLCYTKPCFKHHFDLKEYENVFVDYEHTEIRQLAQRNVTSGEVKSYCNSVGYCYD